MSSTMYSGSALKDMGTSWGNGNLEQKAIRKEITLSKNEASTWPKGWDAFS